MQHVYVYFILEVLSILQLCITFIIYTTNTHVILSLLFCIHVKMPSNQSFENTYNI